MIYHNDIIIRQIFKDIKKKKNLYKYFIWNY